MSYLKKKNGLNSFYYVPKYLVSFTVSLVEYFIVFFYVHDAREQIQNLLQASQESYWITQLQP